MLPDGRPNQVSVPTSRELLAGRYELAGLLGAGGMGEVREAWDTTLNRPVAVKILRGGTDLATHQRFRREVHTLAGLEHPGVVSVFDAGTDGSVAFVVMQLIHGSTLRQRMAEGPMDPGTVRRLGAQLADALNHVHAHGIVHRDVKPANILLDEHARPHLADFGLARLTDSTQLTGSGQIMGTAAYLAPEQVRGDTITPATDIYALGLVLLECLTGHREFDGGEAETALARLHRPPHIPDDLPRDLTRTLALMTSLVPQRRPTAAACAHALRGAELPTALDIPVQRRRPTRWRRPAFALSVAGPLAAALTAFLALPTAPEAEPTPPATSTTAPASTTPSATPPPATPPPTTVAREPATEQPEPPTDTADKPNPGKADGKKKPKP
ncbi:Serine_threonine-protein kinase PknD [Actinosynnema sp. ALI-1.44]